MKMRFFWYVMLLTFLVACGGGSSNTSTNSSDGAVQQDIRWNIQLTLSGNGVVTSNLGHNCNANCSVNLVNQAEVEFNSVPAPGYKFIGWSGACNGTGSCSLIRSTASTINLTANFEPTTQYQLSVNTHNGVISVSSVLESCNSDCQYNFVEGTQLVLNAIPAIGYVFAGWEGEWCSGTSVCQISMNSNRTIRAVFKPLFTVTVNTTGNGSVTSGLLNTPCRGTCQLRPLGGDVIQLTAVPDAGYQFRSWVGSDNCNSATVCQLPLAEQVTITATFIALEMKPNAENIVILTNPHATLLTQYPLQFGRRFAEGEIIDFPQILIDGVIIPTQADVKQRHKDGSVRHAILSAVIQEIPARSAIQLSFINQSAGRNSARLSKEQMLADNFDFDARINATFSGNNLKTVSAREMLVQDKFSYWLEGDIATTVLIVDHSRERLFDFGDDENRSVRPAFYATFWPALNKVQIRYIAEVTNTEAMQDQTYDVQLDSGLKSRKLLYQRSALPHQAMTRWTKQYWHGEQVLKVSLDHNLAYLAKIKVLPNFDASLKIPDSTIVNEYSKWTVANKDLYDSGFWQRRMATAGGRGELGLYPSWVVQWLYSGDWRLAEIALSNSELSASWPMHVREGDSDRTFDKARNISGLGRILSIHQGGRPMAWIPRLEWHEIPPADKIIPLKPLIVTEWRPDNPHHPDYATPQYIMTGDYFYLEQMLFSAAYTTMDNNARGTKSTLGRGPTGSEGALYSNEVRAQAWNFRTRIHTIDIVPDSFPEKEYFIELAENAIAFWDGLYNLRDSKFYDSEYWNYSRNVIAKGVFAFASGQASPLGFWLKDVERPINFVSDQINFSKVAAINTGFMNNYLVVVMGRAAELGYPTKPLLNYIGKNLTDPVKLTEYPLELLSAYHIPSVRRSDGQWMDNWQEVLDGFVPSYIEATIALYRNETNPDLQHGYNLIILAGSSYLVNNPSGLAVYDYYQKKIMRLSVVNTNPKWIIKPR